MKRAWGVVFLAVIASSDAYLALNIERFCSYWGRGY